MARKADKARAAQAEFKELCLPLMKWLAANHHPHHTIIVTPVNAELLEGKVSTGTTLDHIKD